MAVWKKIVVLFSFIGFLFFSPVKNVIGQTSIQGDLNNDGTVNIFDYNILLGDFGKTGTTGWIVADINKDGVVNIFDYNILLGVFGKSAPSPTLLPTQVQTACITAVGSGNWVNSSIAEQTGVFAVEFDATPSQRNTDHSMFIGLSNGAITPAVPADGVPELKTAIEFKTTGFITARNAELWVADNQIPYSPNVNYHFRMEINIPAQTYSVYVITAGGSSQTVGTNYQFRKEKGLPTVFVSALNNFGDFVNSATGTCKVCNITVK